MSKTVVVIWEDPRTIMERKVIKIRSHPLGENDSVGSLDQLFFLWSRGSAGNNSIDISIDTRMEGKDHICRTLFEGKSEHALNQLCNSERDIAMELTYFMYHEVGGGGKRRKRI
jgi:hypothetical protein